MPHQEDRMFYRMVTALRHAAILLAVGISSAHAHHVLYFAALSTLG
jgi:hypothetical protein